MIPDALIPLVGFYGAIAFIVFITAVRDRFYGKIKT